MAHGYGIVLAAMDGLQAAVAREFSARYCPHDEAAFLWRLWGAFALFAGLALASFAAARRSAAPSARTAPYVAAGALLLFAAGTVAFVLYGLSGCSGPAAEGLTWDWP
jgi:hypothetical protein